MEEEEDDSLDENEQDKYPKRSTILLLKSLYEGRPATAFFPYPECCERVRDESRVYDPLIVK